MQKYGFKDLQDGCCASENLAFCSSTELSKSLQASFKSNGDVPGQDAAYISYNWSQKTFWLAHSS